MVRKLSSLHPARLVSGIAALLCLGALSTVVASCATQTVPGVENTDGGSRGVCLLHNCATDAECGGCSLARTRCLPGERRCVACDSETETGCTIGEICSEFGQCIPEGLGCSVDDHGVPTIACAVDSDCAACDPQHQVCDVASGTCVGCTAENTSECPTNSVCIEGACLAECPKTCASDEECGSCGVAGSEAHACNAHKCAECSATSPCPDGKTCSPIGTCETACGTDGAGACMADADCAGCGGSKRCHGEGAADGVCGPSVAACDELVGSDAFLPDPWGSASKVCKAGADCSAVKAELNIGAVIRDMTGIAEVGDGAVPYAMDKCAGEITASGDEPPLVCGVCVPCKVDADCEDVNVDPIYAKLFGAPGTPESAALVDQVFGTNDHIVHMYCNLEGAGFGVCEACPGLVYDCGLSEGSGSGSCDHDPCETGDPLGSDCDACAKVVCSFDSFCCDTEWDAQCVKEASMSCGLMCAPLACAHMECEAGVKLDAMCSPCATAVCEADAYCCSTAWDATCVSEVAANCPMMDCGPLMCMTPDDCPLPLGCLADMTCGPCTADADCSEMEQCDTAKGECFTP